MKVRFLCFLMIFFSILAFFSPNITFAIDGEKTDSYTIYNQQNQKIMEKSDVEVGDTFITPDFEEYEIYYIENNNAYARKIGEIKIEKKNYSNSPQSYFSIQPQTICLYMTHNDESYVPSDGYDSIYGAGGIHDVARELKEQLEKENYLTILDETLHIPHNSSAYSRSGVTATKLFNNYNPDAVFDIHRDGISKSYYYTNQNGQDLSKIRIVVGKSNPNYQQNYEFAKTLFATGNSLYPWLFSDIYSGSGHYNQALKETCLLFEMGTYLIEKEYVINTLPYLVEAIDAVLYKAPEEPELPPTNTPEEPTIDEEETVENENSNNNSTNTDNENDNSSIENNEENNENGNSNDFTGEDINTDTSKDENENLNSNSTIFAIVFTIALLISASSIIVVIYKKDKKKNKKNNKKQN